MKEKGLFWLLFVLVGVSLFINIDINPLFLEEPRRAMVALEMYLQEKLLVPTLYGEFYYRKPPVFNWVLLGSLRAFPDHPEFACRLVSAVSFLLIGLFTYLFCRRYHSVELGRMAALLFLVSVHLLFYGSLFAEIDLFYSCLTFGSILLLFVFHHHDRRLLYFLSIYLLSAIGLLTKGAPSLVFLGVSLPAHLYLNRDLKWLFSWQHLLAIAAFLTVVASFVWAYDQHNPIMNLVTAVWHQSSDQTVINHGIAKVFLHALTYPTEVIRDLLPVSLFVPFLFVRRIRQQLWEHPMLRFVAVLFVANILVYWLSPGTRSRYVYMLYPLAVIICSWLFLKATENHAWVAKAMRALNLFLVAVCVVAMALLPFIGEQFGLPKTSILFNVLSMLMLFIIGFAAYGRKVGTQMWWLIALLIFVRIQFDVLILPVRASQGEHLQFKVHGEKLAELSRGKKLWLYRYDTVADEASLTFGHGFYIEWNRQEVMRSTQEKNCRDLFLTQDFEVRNEPFELLYEFDHREDRWLLVRFTDCP